MQIALEQVIVAIGQPIDVELDVADLGSCRAGFAGLDR